MTKEIRVRPAMEWRLSFLSSGEISLADHLQTIRRQVHGGQEVRLIDLAADAGKGMGVFENLNGASSPDVFANELSSAALTFYGSPIADFLEKLVVEREQVPEVARGFIQKFLNLHVPSSACGEVSRAARRFALVAFAGEYASSMGVTGWEEGEAMRAAVVCFKSWLERRGSLAAGDTESAISQVRNFITANGSGRFETICPDDDAQVEKAAIHNRAGFRQEVADADGAADDNEPEQKRYIYLVLPEAFRREVCRGFDPEMVAKGLKDRGHLECEEGRLTRQKRLPGLGKQRVYCILPSVLEVAS
jgi:putative DNA primase/helicase